MLTALGCILVGSSLILFGRQQLVPVTYLTGTVLLPAELDQRTADQDAADGRQHRRAISIGQPPGQRHGQTDGQRVRQHPEAGMHGCVAHEILEKDGKKKTLPNNPTARKTARRMLSV